MSALGKGGMGEVYRVAVLARAHRGIARVDFRTFFGYGVVFGLLAGVRQ